MSSIIYTRDEIADTIIAQLVSVIETALAHGGSNPAYSMGALSLAKSTALSFGIPWSTIQAKVRTTVAPELWDESHILIAGFLYQVAD